MLFDAHIFVDWSARNALAPKTPRPDAVWVGELVEGEATEVYCRSRHEAAGHVRTRLVGHVRRQRRVLVGFDFPYGYPSGLASFTSRDGTAPWRAVWDFLGERITDDEANKSNRFEVAAELNRSIRGGPGPFWGCPAGTAHEGLTRTMKGLFTFPYEARGVALRRLRQTETAIGGVQEAWRLMGAGSVGSQALVGIPRVRDLRDDPDLAQCSGVWPFETGFTADPAGGRRPFVLHVEIWPGIISVADVAREQEATGAIRDQAQVRLMCRWASAQDQAGALGSWLDPRPRGRDVVRRAVHDEGWILGCVPTGGGGSAPAVAGRSSAGDKAEA
jgi:hypothetical protein